MTNQQVAYTMQKKIADGFSNFMSDLLKDCDLPEDMADLPLNFNSPVYGSANPNFTEFMAPGIIIIIIFFLAVALTGEAFIAEKQVCPKKLIKVYNNDLYSNLFLHLKTSSIEDLRGNKNENQSPFDFHIASRQTIK